MVRKVKCKICMETKMETDKYKCYTCNTFGCSQCIKLACCDCEVIICNNCILNGEIKCKCYGNCSYCGNNVDRGNDGWPCFKCKKWLCYCCKFKTDCKECKSEE